jgi:uncharacterized integral membrane protein
MLLAVFVESVPVAVESELMLSAVFVESEAVAVLRDLNAVPSISASIVLSEAHTVLRLFVTELSEESVTATAVVKTGFTSLATLLICACKGVFFVFLNHLELDFDFPLLVDFLLFFLAAIVLVGLVWFGSSFPE